jgi:hypothetical protein
MASGPADPAMIERLLAASANFSAANLTQSFMTDMLGFYHAVDWSEPWLRGLAVFHILVWTIAIAFRRWDNVQMLLLVSILGVVYSAETLNRLGGEHWQQFAGQNYFDKHGVFMSVLWSAPLLGDAFLLIYFALRSSAALLVQVKRAELRHNRKASASRKTD